MSVGKESIKRAASTSTAATATKKTTAKKTTTKKAAAKPAEAAVEVAAVEAAPAEAEVKTSVLTPMDADEVQAKFLSEAPVDDKYRPVRVLEPMPVHLL